jgi:hypothetical protein
VPGDRERDRGPAGGGGVAGETHDSDVDPRLRAAQLRRARERRAGRTGPAKDDPNGLMEPASLKDGKSAKPGNAEKGGHVPTGDELMEPDFTKDAKAGKADLSDKDALMAPADLESDGVSGHAGPIPGDTGILSGEVTLKLGGKDAKLTSGTVVEVIGGAGARLRVKVFSGHKGDEAQIDSALFKSEPGVAKQHDQERDDVYQEYQGKLWNDGGPKIDDVKQGYIGDCYLMAGIGAVCLNNPGAIKHAFKSQEPNQKSYTVTLFKSTKEGLKPVDITVDTMLPSLKGQDHQFAYANLGKDAKTSPLWPALLEKAYTQVLADVAEDPTYARIGDGGASSRVMETITGVESDRKALPPEASILEKLRGYEKAKTAVTCSSIGQLGTTLQKVFREHKGAYSATLTTQEGLKCELVPGSLQITDSTSKKPMSARDDGKGKIVGATLQSGTVDYYDTQKVELGFKKDQQPDKPQNLDASYQFRGQLKDSLNIHANHEYTFVRVEGDRIILRNPWGNEHPAPLTVEQFNTYFQTLQTNQAPKADGG